VSVKVDSVIDQLHRGSDSAFLGDLALDGLRYRDQLVHLRGKEAQLGPVFSRPDARRVDGRDDVGPRQTDLSQPRGGARSYELRPIHVVVDDVRADAGHVGGQGTNGRRVVGLIEDEDEHAQSRDLARGGPGREQDYARLKPRAIQARKQRVQVLLRAAAAPRGEDLDDTHLGPPGQGRQHERLDAGIRRWSGLERRAGGGQSQIAVRRTRMRWSGSSTAPHSYLYGSLPRRKSTRRRPSSIARLMSQAIMTTPGDRSFASGSIPAL